MNGTVTRSALALVGCALLLTGCGHDSSSAMLGGDTERGTLIYDPPSRIASLDAATFGAQNVDLGATIFTPLVTSSYPNSSKTSLSLPASVGPVGTVGLSYRFSRHFSVYASYSISRVDPRLTADTAGVIRTSHIAFNPRATVVSAGYSF